MQPFHSCTSQGLEVEVPTAPGTKRGTAGTEVRAGEGDQPVTATALPRFSSRCVGRAKWPLYLGCWPLQENGAILGGEEDVTLSSSNSEKIPQPQQETHIWREPSYILSFSVSHCHNAWFITDFLYLLIGML